MLKRISPKEWIQIAVGIMVVIYMGNFFSTDMTGHIYQATQGRPVSKILSRLYLGHVLEINSTTRVNGKTPIQYAITNFGPLTDKKIRALTPVIKSFIKEGVDINALSDYGFTALHYAIADEDAKAVEFLISNKANVNQPNQDLSSPTASQIPGMTPLRFLEERRKEKHIKNEKRMKEIEKLLTTAGGISEGGPAPIVETPKSPTPVVKTSEKKKKK
jgi:ankyrin repeat protein